MLCSQNFFNTSGIHYFNKGKVVVIHYDLVHVQCTDVEQNFFSFHKWNEDLTICEPDVCNFFVDKIKKKHISCRKVLSKNSKHFLVVYFVNVLRS